MITKKSFAVLLTVAALSLPAMGIAQAQGGGRQPNRPALDMMQQIVTLVTEATGLTTQELMQELRSGKTLADIVTEKGGDIAALTAQAETAITATINQAVTDGKLTQAQADLLLANLPQAIEDFATGTRPAMGMGGMNMGQFFQGRGERGNSPMQQGRGERGNNPAQALQDLSQLVQSKTGLTATELRQQLQSGKTLGQVLADANVNLDEFVTEALAPMRERLTADVTAGTTTQAIADARVELARLELTQRLNDPAPARPVQDTMQLVQDKTGLTAEELRQQLQGGKTIAQLLADANVNLDEFVTEALAPVQERLTADVTAGTISQALADARLALFRVELTERLNSNNPLSSRGNRR